MSLNPFYPLSMANIATELGLSLPLSLNHAWVIALAGKGSLPVSFSDLLGKTGRYDGTLTGGSAGGSTFVDFPASPFFGGTLNNLVTNLGVNETQINFTGAPNWSGNIIAKNNSSGISVVLPKINSTTWQGAYTASLVRSGFNDNFTILPHA